LTTSSMGKLTLPKSPERLFISMERNCTFSLNELKHIERYKLASLFARGKILDMACGSGYGSWILADKGNVTAIDRNADAIKFAKQHNDHEDIEFIEGLIETYVPKERFTTIVCLETFEHLSCVPGFEMLEKFRDWLDPDGQLILSTPMLRYKNGEPYVTNPHHLNEMARQPLLNQFEYVFQGMQITYFHQDNLVFRPLSEEHTGFLIAVVRNCVKRRPNT